jgi:hypothetical protein
MRTVTRADTRVRGAIVIPIRGRIRTHAPKPVTSKRDTARAPSTHTSMARSIPLHSQVARRSTSLTTIVLLLLALLTLVLLRALWL